ncbi:MAG TPA: hypothetical protein VM821_00400, partial [Abditibacteriaceae bacterium]|nr:hypothetical protein [Abditibacteriaceae bacterium]
TKYYFRFVIFSVFFVFLWLFILEMKQQKTRHRVLESVGGGLEVTGDFRKTRKDTARRGSPPTR